MFERFTSQAREVVLAAVREAEEERAGQVTPEHLLLALLREGTRSAPVLTGAGLTREAMEAAFAAARRRGGLSEPESAALTELGIDLTAIVDRIEAAHGPNALAPTPVRRSRFPLSHVPFSAEAKSVLVRALTEARERGDRHIADEHFLLALSTGPGPIPHLLAAHDLTYATLRTRLPKAG